MALEYQVSIFTRIKNWYASIIPGENMKTKDRVAGMLLILLPFSTIVTAVMFGFLGSTPLFVVLAGIGVTIFIIGCFVCFPTSKELDDMEFELDKAKNYGRC